MMQALGSFFVPVMVLLIVVALLALAKAMANNYIKVPPNKAAVFYGREYKGGDGKQVGFKVVTGGSRFKRPVVESVQFLNLATFSINLQVDNVPNKDGVLVNAKGVALVKILSEETSLMAAVERFLGKTEDDVKNTAHQNLEGHLRSIVGRLTVEELVSDRSKFNQAVLDEAAADLRKIGLGIDMLTIQHIDDQQGYITALGQRRTAEVQRDAKVGKARAESEAEIEASNAAKRAALVKNQNDTEVADAEKALALRKAEIKAEVDRQNAISALAGQLATAERERELKQKQVEVETSETEARTALAVKAAERREQELVAEVIKPAEAKRQAASIEAEGVKAAAIIRANQEKEAKVIGANADREAAVLSAEAVRTIATAEAEAARQKGKGAADALQAQKEAEAAGLKAQKEAEAAGTEANLLAQAKGTEAQKKAEAAGTEAGLLAEAKGVEAKLLAEAKGKEALALALAKLDSTGKLLQVLEAAPRLAEAIGAAAAEALGPKGAAAIFGEVAKPLASVDSIRVLDMGGSNGSGQNGVMKIANMGPELVFQFLSNMEARGFKVNDLLAKIGLSSDVIGEFLGEALKGKPSEGANS